MEKIFIFDHQIDAEPSIKQRVYYEVDEKIRELLSKNKSSFSIYPAIENIVIETIENGNILNSITISKDKFEPAFKIFSDLRELEFRLLKSNTNLFIK